MISSNSKSRLVYMNQEHTITLHSRGTVVCFMMAMRGINFNTFKFGSECFQKSRDWFRYSGLDNSNIKIHCCVSSVDLGFICIFSGSRGLLREIWTSTIKSILSDIALLDSEAPDYHVQHWTESSSPEVDTFNKISGYSSKITAFFVPPKTDNFRFYIQSDDSSALYLSRTGDPANKVHISQLARVGALLVRIISLLTLDPNFC